MPRLSKKIPKYCQKKQFNLAYVKLNGKQRFLGTYDTPEAREKYDRLIILWIANGRTLPDDWEQQIEAPSPSTVAAAEVNLSGAKSQAPESTTIGEMILAYLPYAKTFYKENRSYEQIAQVCRFLRNHYERLPANSFGPEQLFAIRNHWIINGWGRKHTNDMVKRLVAMFRWAAEKSASPRSRLHVPLQIWDSLKTVRGLPKGRPLFTFDGVVVVSEDGDPIIPRDGQIAPPIDDESVDRTIPFLPPVIADMVRFQRVTGCRPGEVCKLRPMDIGNTETEIWIYRPPHHKTEHVESDDGRVIPIGATGQQLLSPYLDRAPDAPCFSPRESEQRRRQAKTAKRRTKIGQGNSVGSNRRPTPTIQPGDSYSVSTYNKAIRRAIDKVNALADQRDEERVSRWSANQLRKTFALKIRNQKGLGLDHSQVVLGHKQRATTEKWYARNEADARAIEVAKELG